MDLLEAWLKESVFHANSPVKPITVEGDAATSVKNILNQRWLCATNSKKRMESWNRNGFGQLRIQLSGAARVLVVSGDKLGAAYGDDLDTMVDTLRKATDEELEPLIGRGAVQVATVPAWSCLYIPAARLVFDDVSEGILAYYIRIPLLPCTKENASAYERFVQLARSAKRGGIDKMETVVSIMQEGSDSA